MKTKYGTAKLDNKGYYVIKSRKEGNRDKYLHRLIARDYFGEWIDEPTPYGDKWVIHHIDRDKTNNCVLNLEPMPEHDHNFKMSMAQNTSGYYRVYKRNCKTCKQGFLWVYRYYDENGKRIAIESTDIEKLEAKVKEKGLPWKKFEKEMR